MNDERGESKIGGLGWGFGGMLVIYFGFPAVWYWPIWKVYGSMPPRWLLPFFVPIGWLAERLPVYSQWVNWSGELLGMK